MNSTLPADYLERMAQDDPEAYRSEVLGEFRQGISALFDPEALDAVVATGVRERPPQRGYKYVCFTDASSGSGSDAFATAVAHRDGDVAVLDALRVRKPPFEPSSAIAEAAELAKAYGVREMNGDRFAPGFVQEGFASHGLLYRPSTRDRSALYLELLPAANSSRVSLLDIPELLKELRGLERRRGTGGKDRCDHRRGSHDDAANACAGALVLCEAYAHPGRGRVGTFDLTTGERIQGFDGEGREYRNGRPFNGTFGPGFDVKGRPVTPPETYVDGVLQPTDPDWRNKTWTAPPARRRTTWG
jgi:hypothetical protein